MQSAEPTEAEPEVRIFRTRGERGAAHNGSAVATIAAELRRFIRQAWRRDGTRLRAASPTIAVRVKIIHLNEATLFPHEFHTSRPPRSIYCHQEFLDKLEARRNEPTGKRAALLMQRMAVDIARLHYKGANGANRGWRRSRLGGGSGFHFYAWWAPSGAAPLKHAGGFGNEPEAVFLRDIRHHDDHAPLSPGDADKDYLPLSVPDLRGVDYAPAPWTPPQTRFAHSRATARILKGHPGSGKTTALLYAADESHASRVLYLTFSRDLAALARDYFDRFCSDARTFVVQTYPDWLRQVSGRGESQIGIEEGRARFRRDLINYQRALGPWQNRIEALYDEMHAHLVGAAVPEKSGRFSAAERQRLPDSAYRSQRGRYLGPAADNVLEAAHRLERAEGATLADRYFPELSLAWRGARALSSKAGGIDASLLNYGCIAVDEVQDLTPLEVFTVIALARQAGSGGRHAPLLLAGDEAQTVRATDFEWAWLNDMLHDSMGAPQEFKLPVNLRSPRRIADLVNRAWDLYDHLAKQDRPSGTGYAEIDDDSPDEVLYAALRESDLPELLTDFAAREGLAMIAFDKAGIPQNALAAVLSPAEAKGLDFHSVCILNGGALLRRIADPRVGGPAGTLTRRLAIDQLRVALSRPTERLIWVDVAPDPTTVVAAGQLLRGHNDMALLPMTREALLATLAEEELDVDERIQRCQKDARQFVDVKPDLAWSRAQQAVTMTGPLDGVAADLTTRRTAYLTLSEVCFQLAFRRKTLSPELGKPDLYMQAAEAARAVMQFDLAAAIRAIAESEPKGPDHRERVMEAIECVSVTAEEMPSWLVVEIAPRAEEWVAEVDRYVESADTVLNANLILPAFFELLNLPDAEARRERIAQRTVRTLMKARKHALALPVFRELPRTEANRRLTAECQEESGQFAAAAATYLELGEKEKALKCFRSLPDFEASLGLVRELENHPARESLEWLAELGAMLGKRPENFNRVMTAPEKKLLEAMLERGLGVQRQKPVKKAPTKKTAAAKTGPAKAAATKKAAEPSAKKSAAGPVRKRKTASRKRELF
jgi:hypothetical protein